MLIAPSGVNLVSASGLRKLKIEAHRRKADVKFYVEQEIKAEAKGKVTARERGTFANFPTMEEAVKHADSVAETAKKDGWAPVERKAGFPMRVESFTLASLPKPDAAPAPAAAPATSAKSGKSKK